MKWGLIHPGSWALVPVLSAFLIITAGPKAWVNQFILSNRVLVWFGLISFPLYLWHWPLLTFARIVETETPSISIRFFIIFLSIFLSWLTYIIIERPIRFSKKSVTSGVILLSLMLVIGYAGFNAYSRNGLIFRDIVVRSNAPIPLEINGVDNAVLNSTCGLLEKADEVKFDFCVSDIRKPLKFALVGDSKAAALFGGLIRTSSDKGRWLFIGGNGPQGPLVPVVSSSDVYKNYQPLSTIAINALANNTEITTVVFVTATRFLFLLSNDSDIEDLPYSKHFSVGLEGLKNSIQILKDAGKNVILVTDNPTLAHPEDCFNRMTGIAFVDKFMVRENPKCSIALEKHILLSKNYRKLLKEIKSIYPKNVHIFETINYLCDETSGVCGHMRDGKFLYSYTDHISDFAADLIGQDLNNYLNKN